MLTQRRDVVSQPLAAEPAAKPATKAEPNEIALREHLLNRFGYGGSPKQRAEFDHLGSTGWLTKQIDKCAVPGGIPKWQKSPADYQLEGDNTLETGRKGMLNEVVRRAISTEPSLAVVLTDHWFNHFNVFAYMGIPKHQLDGYLNDAITPSIVGNFSEMLLSTMKHPAMLQYLNNRKNHKVATDAPVVKPEGTVSVAVGPNQNYAREILELHTVGAENHSQADVEAATRILSGASSNFYGQAADEYTWRQSWHDDGAKQLLGHSFPAGGDETELELLADFLALRPETSFRIGQKLAQRFIGPTASAVTVNAIAEVHHLAVEDPRVHDDLGVAMREVAHAYHRAIADDLGVAVREVAHAYHRVDPAIFGSKFKPPHRFVVSAYRSLGITPSPATLDFLVDELVLLDDMPFFYGPPTGFPDADAYWLTGDGMLARAQIARAISIDPAMQAALDDLRTIEDPTALAQAVIFAFLPAGVSTQTHNVVLEAISRSMPDTRVEAMAEVVLSSPEFLEY